MRVVALLRARKCLTLPAFCLLFAFQSQGQQLHSFVKRDYQGDVVELSRSDPVQAAHLVQQFPGLANNATADADNSLAIVKDSDSDTSQLPWNSNVIFTATPDTNISAEGGWQAIPELAGFQMNRSWEVVPGAIMPFYVKADMNPAAIKRAIISWPGKPRDTWKYANLYRNALNVVEANQSSGVQNNSILIVAPIWLNELDQQAGSVRSKELYFSGSNWQAGGSSLAPVMNNSLSAYSIMDNFTDMLFDRSVYPNLNQVVIAGHSMGGQASHRYAILKKQKTYDDNLSYWVGNPGSWTFLSADRPYHNESCTDTYDTWHYGIGGNTTKITKYARKDVLANKNAVVRRYMNRKVRMALGLLDYGPGDTHCQARDQGGSHLDRGSNMILHLAKVNNGTFPPAQTVDFIANTSHQDFAMISSNNSLFWLFQSDYDKRYPDIVATNPGDGVHLKVRPIKEHLHTTPLERILSASLFGGSLFTVLLFFTILPFLCPPNWTEEDEPTLATPDSCYPGPASPWGHTTSLLDPRNSLPRQVSIPLPKISVAPSYMSSHSLAPSPLQK